MSLSMMPETKMTMLSGRQNLSWYSRTLSMLVEDRRLSTVPRGSHLRSQLPGYNRLRASLSNDPGQVRGRGLIGGESDGLIFDKLKIPKTFYQCMIVPCKIFWCQTVMLLLSSDGIQVKSCTMHLLIGRNMHRIIKHCSTVFTISIHMMNLTMEGGGGAKNGKCT